MWHYFYCPLPIHTKMNITRYAVLFLLILSTFFFSSCSVLRDSAKYSFTDGPYRTKKITKEKVYVMKVDEDTIAVFPIQEFKDSSAIIVKKRINYTSAQKKLKDNKTSVSFYRPSFDLDVMTMPLKYRPATAEIPNQLVTTFNGAIFGGYRIDAYNLRYKQTPLNTYKQNIRHSGYSAGVYAGLGNAIIDASTLANPHYDLQYEGVLLLVGIATNFAVNDITFGFSFGTDYLLDRNHESWIYQGKPNVGFTLGLNIN